MPGELDRSRESAKGRKKWAKKRLPQEPGSRDETGQTAGMLQLRARSPVISRYSKNTYKVTSFTARMKKVFQLPNASCHSSAPLSITMNAADSQASASGTPRTRQPRMSPASEV